MLTVDFAQILDKISDGILLADRLSLQFIYANQAMGKMLGYDKEKLLSFTIADIFKQNDFPEIKNFLAEQKPEGNSLFTNIPVLKANGEILYTDICYSLIEFENQTYYLGVFRDVTQRKLREQETTLNQEKEKNFAMRLSLLAEIMLELSAAPSLDELCYKAVKLGLEKLKLDRLSFWFLADNPQLMHGSFGVDPQGNIADERKECFALTIDEVIKPVINGKEKVLLAQDVPLYFNTKLVGYGSRITAGLWDGEKIIGFMSVDNLIHQQPFSEHEKELIRLFALAVGHLSKQKKIEEERKILQEELFQAQKMESVGRLAGGIAHDLNNMLSVIIGLAEINIQQLDPSHPLVNDLEQILQASQHSSKLINQLLAFARKQITRPQILNLDKAILNYLPMLRKFLGDNIQLEFKSSTQNCFIRLDPNQLEQILANLLTNANNAIKDRGSVLVSTNCVYFDYPVLQRYDSIPPGEYASLTVSDTGCGMDEETKAHLFEPFYSTKKDSFKSGLGLATVYGMVKQNNGYISAESELGKGTTIKLFFPRIKEVLSPPSISQAQAKIKIQTILLVEDEPMVLGIARTALERAGYKVIACSSADEALKEAETYPEKIDLLLTDVVMQQINGPELASRLLLFRPELKVLYMSGYSFEKLNGLKIDDLNFLAKPFSIQELINKVNRLIK